MNLIYSDKVIGNKEKFLGLVNGISNQLDINPNWLMMVMNFESGLNPQRVNPYSGAVGLIQFMPNTAKALGTSIDELKKMDNYQQLTYVFKYLKPFSGKIKYFIDLYFAVFFPLAINKPSEWIFETAKLNRSLIAKQNPVFDTNKDGKISVSEVEAFFVKKIPASFIDLFKKKAYFKLV